VILDLKNLHKILETASKSSLILSVLHPQEKKLDYWINPTTTILFSIFIRFLSKTAIRQIFTLPPSSITGNIDETTTASLTLFFNSET
jgi:hypothetical protein